MKGVFLNILALLGLCAMVCMLAFLISQICNKIEDAYRKQEREYRYRHRFDKEPIARCYCIDCEYYGQGPYKESCGLSGVDRLMGDTDFCSHASPANTREPDEEEND